MRNSRTALRAAAAGATVMLLSIAFAGAALGEHTGPLVTPTVVDHPTGGAEHDCPDGALIKWDSGESGEVKSGITVSWEGNLASFDTGDSGLLVSIAYIKGGDGTEDSVNMYDYTGQPGGGVDHDNNLTTPFGDVSHVTLCVFEPEEATEPPTAPPTAPPTEPPTAPPTEPPTAPPTEPPTAPPTEPPTLPPTGTEPPTAPPTLPPTDALPPIEPTSGGMIWLIGLIVMTAAGLTTYAFVNRAKASARRRS